jgi:hypothetical protein
VLRVSAPVALGRAHVSPVCRDLVRTHARSRTTGRSPAAVSS